VINKICNKNRFLRNIVVKFKKLYNFIFVLFLKDNFLLQLKLKVNKIIKTAGYKTQ